MHISASILACDILNIQTELEAIKMADSIHFDVMDGEYVEQISFGSNLCASLNKVSLLPIHVHLMVNHPEKKIYEFIKAGASSIIIHPSACKNDLPEIAKNLKTKNIAFGLAIDSKEDFSIAIENMLLADFFVFMTTKIGHSFQKIDPDRIVILEQFSKMITPKKEIFVDGGIDDSNIKLCLKNGATGVISGGFIFKTHPHSLAIKKLRMNYDE